VVRSAEAQGLICHGETLPVCYDILIVKIWRMQVKGKRECRKSAHSSKRGIWGGFFRQSAGELCGESALKWQKMARKCRKMHSKKRGFCRKTGQNGRISRRG